MLEAAERGCAVLGADTGYVPAPSRIDADHGRRPSVRPDHEIADPKTPDRPEAGGREDTR